MDMAGEWRASLGYVIIMAYGAEQRAELPRGMLRCFVKTPMGKGW